MKRNIDYTRGNPKRKMEEINKERSVISPNQVIIDEYRASLLSFIIRIWQHALIIEYFEPLATITTTYLSDIKAPEAFYHMTEEIGSYIYNFLGFFEFESYNVKTKEGVESVINFSLPSKQGSYINLILLL